MFVPAVAGEIALGRWLTQFMPHPGLIAVLCFAPAIVVLFIFGMFIGATMWLLLTERFLLQNPPGTFCLGGPRVAIVSSLCSSLSGWAHVQVRRTPTLCAGVRW